MPVQNSYSPGNFTGNGVTTVFAYGFKIFEDTDLLVRIDGVTKTITTDYTVSGAGSESGGNVTFAVAPANGASVTIERNLPYTRETDYQRNGAFEETTVDQDFDDLQMQIQQIYDQVKRAPVVALPAAGVTQPIILPTGAGKGFRWNVGGTALEAVTLDDLGDTFLQSGADAVTRSWTSKVGEIVSVKDFGAAGDGVTNDTVAIQAAITAAQAGAGNTIYFPPGTYKTGRLTVTKGGIRLVGASQESTILSMTVGGAGTYCVDVDLTAGGLSRPLSFGMENFSIIGNDPVTRTYSGIKLYNVYHPQLKNLYFKSLAKCLTLGGTFWGTFENCWFEFYGTGIEGLSAIYPGNTNTFIGMLFFEGNSAGTAIPIDGTYMGNNTYLAPSFGSSVSAGCASIVAGNGDTFISPRLESITSTDHWMKLGNNAKVINALVTSSVALATGKYVFDVLGYQNHIECDFSSLTRTVRLESTAQHNAVELGPMTPSFGNQPVLDLGTNNRISFGKRDHMQGNDTNACASSWSDFRVHNLITRSIDHNNMVVDGLTKAIDNTERGPELRGGCYKYDAPTGNRQVTQSIGAVNQNECYAMSFWVKAVSGGETSTVQACFSENPAADYADRPITITSERWTRVILGKKFTGNFANAYFGIRLPVAHPGIWVYGPQVVYLGSNASSGEFPPAFAGGYVPTDAAARAENTPREAWRFQRGAPTGGLWYRGDRVINLTLNAGAGSPGQVCITDGEPGTWKAEANVAA